MNTSIRRTLILTAAIVPLAATVASAQYRIDNGTARDANNRIGSGGYNDRRADNVIANNRVGGLAGNYIVTGNVTGFRAFRGDIDYTDPSAFRGRLGSANFDPFIRDSTGIGTVRGDYGFNGAINPQPFFGNRTVAPPPGFVRNQAENGTFIQRTAAPVLPNDSRVDYGGASRAQVTQSLIDSRQQYGNAGFAPTTGMQWTGANGADQSMLQLSEYTSLARQRQDLFSGTDPTRRLNETNDPTRDNSTPSEPGSISPDRTNNRQSTDPTTPDNRLEGSGPIQQSPDASNGETAAPGETGQSLSRRSNRAVDNNPQYAQLRDRLAQVRGERENANGDEATRNNASGANQPIGGQPIGAGGAVSTGQGRQPGTVVRPTTPDASPDATANQRPGENTNTATADGTAGRTTPDARTPAGEPGTERTTTPGADRQVPIGPADPANADRLQLPRPEGAPVAPRTATPVEIKSLTTGVKDPQLVKVLTEAETLMKAGKFGSAIDAFERAEQVAADDPLVFMGRSIAELGGGYYRNAELHLRQAFAADEALLLAKFDLRAMIGDDRLNALAGNLSEIAGKNASDPGPLLLLAFIYYNGGMEDRAARALDMAQVRAGGKDLEVEALRKNWSLGTTPSPNAQEENK